MTGRAINADAVKEYILDLEVISDIARINKSQLETEEKSIKVNVTLILS